MKKFYISPLVLLIALLCLSCDSESSETATNPEARIAPMSSNQLRIVNNSELLLTGDVYCFGAHNNLVVDPSIKIKGRIQVPAGTDITYKNFAQATNPNYAINTWYVSQNGNSAVAYNASQINNVYGQLYSPGTSATKFANWRYLKVKLTAPGIQNMPPVDLTIELPQYSSNNSEDRVVDLTPYGLQKYLHISQASFYNSAGNTILTIDSELIDQ